MIKILPTSTSSQKWAKHARNYAYRLLATFGQRDISKVKYMGDGVYALFKLSHTGYHKVILWGGGESWQIVLTNYLNVHAYNYLNDVLVDTGLNISGADDSYPILPFANGRTQIGDQYYVQLAGGWTGGLTGNGYEFLGALTDYEVGYFSDGSTIYGRVGDSIQPVLSLTKPIIPGLAAPYGSLFSVPVYRAGAPWNLFDSAIQYTLNPANPTANASWYWQPSFFTAQPADGAGLAPGFYYGRYPGAVHDIVDGDGVATALETAHVALKAVMDTRYTSTLGSYQYGWAELLSSVNGQAVNRLYLYLQDDPLPVYTNNTFGYYRIAGTIEDMTIWVGADLTGFDATTSLDVPADADISMWNFNIWTDPDDLLSPQDTGVGIAVIDGTSATFHRFSGFTQTVCETDIYHSHSISSNGQILAVFESADGVLITGVKVYDLYGTRDNVKTPTYSLGGFTELQDSLSVTTALATSACIIPNRAEEFTPSTPVLGESAEPSDYTDYLSSMAQVVFAKGGDSPVSIKKVTCTNGVDAYLDTSIDECFDSVFILEDPDLGVEERHLVGWWDAGGIFKGVVRGTFTGEHPNIKFQGEGTPWIDPITMPEEFTVYSDGTYDKALGDVTIDGPFDAPDTDCEDTQFYDKYVGRTSCGQTGQYVVEVPPFSGTVGISGDRTRITVGQVWVASGGKPPYTNWTFGGGSLSISGTDNDTATVTSLSPCVTGDPRYYDVTVEDACGNTALITVSVDDDGDWCCPSGKEVISGPCCVVGAPCCLGFACCAGESYDIDAPGTCSQPYLNPYTVKYPGEVGGFLWQEIFYAVSGAAGYGCCEKVFGSGSSEGVSWTTTTYPTPFAYVWGSYQEYPGAACVGGETKMEWQCNP